jgi:signal transduction histidine kinase
LRHIRIERTRRRKTFEKLDQQIRFCTTSDGVSIAPRPLRSALSRLKLEAAARSLELGWEPVAKDAARHDFARPSSLTRREASREIDVMRRPTFLATHAQGTMLALVFTAVIGSFLVSTIVVQRASTDVEEFADSIIHISTPSIEQLASVRASVLHIELLLSRYLHEPEARASIRPQVEASLRRLDDDVRGYLTLPTFPREASYWLEMQRAWTSFDQEVRRARELSDAGRSEEAVERFGSGVEPSAQHLLDAAISGIEFHAEHGQTLAVRIKELRSRTIVLANGLTAFCVLLGLVGALLIHRQARRRRAEVEEHSALIEARAAELEQFAGRVAHDIRNPLSSAKIACDLLLHFPPNERGRELGGKIDRSLGRADAIIAGLLEFARSGAHPDPGARTDVQEVVSDLESGASQEAAALGIDLDFETAPPIMVACGKGVYLSLLGNLVRNAIKYIGDKEPRKISVRVEVEEAFVRTSVSDTGPGIPRENLPQLFEPYFRASTKIRDGIGLGLATVKKLAEAHGGRVGVRSELGEGSTFWFLLPHAGSKLEPVAEHDLEREEGGKAGAHDGRGRGEVAEVQR